MKYGVIVCIAALLGSALTPCVWAVPAAPIIVTLTQSDGSTFEAMPRGDEYASWMETLDGISIVQAGGEWYYAVQGVTGDIVSSGSLVGSVSEADLAQWPRGIVPVVDPAAREQHFPRRYRDAADATRALTHTQNILTILVDFTDISFTYSDASFQDLMYGGSASVKDYFDKNSYGNFTIVTANESYGTANDGVIHVSLGIAHPDLGKGNWRPTAVKILNAANASIDYSSFDSDGSGEISPGELSIVMILAGYENAFGGEGSLMPRVWGHMASMAAVNRDGVDITKYTMYGERHGVSVPGTHQATIGIACHELGHLMLGLQDLYDTNGGSEGIGDWGLMGAGSWNSTGVHSGDLPTHLCASSKLLTGMASAIDVVSSRAGVLLPQVETDPTIRRLWIDEYKSPIGEHFLLENRQRTGYDAGMDGDGLLIWHIDQSIRFNTNEAHKMVDLEAADGYTDLDDQFNQGDSGDPFPGAESNTIFDDASTPNSKDYAAAATGISVSEISTSSSAMTATLTPRSIPFGDSLFYDEQLYTGTAIGYDSETVWTALKVNNTTLRDTIDGFEVYTRGTSATVDFQLYERLVFKTPTTLIHSQTGFAASTGWNRFMLSSPQSFPAGSTRTMVLKIVDPLQNFPAALDSRGPVSNRSLISPDGTGSYFRLDAAGGFPSDLAQHLLLSGGEFLNPAEVWVDFTYSGTEVGSQNAPFNTLAEGLDNVNIGGVVMIKPGSSSEIITIDQDVTLNAPTSAVTIGSP